MEEAWRLAGRRGGTCRAASAAALAAAAGLSAAGLGQGSEALALLGSGLLGGSAPVAGAVVILLISLGLALLMCRSCTRRPENRRPPFEWKVSEDFTSEFVIGGRWRETVEKHGDFGRPDMVLPANGRIEMKQGRIYRWALVIEQVNREREEVQFGIQGVNFDFPWRLVTATRCSRACDHEERWLPRPLGDRAIQEHQVVHLELDFRHDHGSLMMAVDDEPFELVFADIPTAKPVMPAVMLGGDASRVRVQATSRSSRDSIDPGRRATPQHLRLGLASRRSEASR